MTFTINEQILQFNFLFKIYFDPHHTEKKTSNSVYREGPSLSAQILNEKSAFSPAPVVFEK